MIETLDTQLKTDIFLKTDYFLKMHPDVDIKDPKARFIYKITDMENRKIYIGKTKNIYRRAREYMSVKKEYKRHRSITDAIIMKGIDKFIMEPIDFAYDDVTLASLELQYIINLNATNPDIGYNTNDDKSVIPPATIKQKPRVQLWNERMRRSKIFCAINPDSKDIIFSTGLKLFGDRIGRDKDEIKSAAKRLSRMEGYYLYYLNSEDYAKQEDFINVLMMRPNRTTDIDSFLEWHEYVINFLTLGENPYNFTVRFICQADNVEKFEYRDVSEFIDYYKHISNSLHV